MTRATMLRHRQVSVQALFALAILVVGAGHAGASPVGGPPFTRTLSNNVPLAFGMTPADATVALGTPLSYVAGRPGHEVLLAIREIGGGRIFPRADRLYLQFRKGRLTGWKGDWGRRWIWE